MADYLIYQHLYKYYLSAAAVCVYEWVCVWRGETFLCHAPDLKVRLIPENPPWPCHDSNVSPSVSTPGWSGRQWGRQALSICLRRDALFSCIGCEQQRPCFVTKGGQAIRHCQPCSSLLAAYNPLSLVFQSPPTVQCNLRPVAQLPLQVILYRKDKYSTFSLPPPSLFPFFFP